MRRGGLACRRPIPSLQDFSETVGSPFAQSHFDYRSHYGADHVFQKSVGVGIDVDFFALA